MPEKNRKGVTPLEIAATLDANATKAMQALPQLRHAVVEPSSSAKEYAATLGDIEAMALLGKYYAAKIRGACDLALFDKTGDVKQQAFAINHLETALTHWKKYATAYNAPVCAARPVQPHRRGGYPRTDR